MILNKLVGDTGISGKRYLGYLEFGPLSQAKDGLKEISQKKGLYISFMGRHCSNFIAIILNKIKWIHYLKVRLPQLLLNLC